MYIFGCAPVFISRTRRNFFVSIAFVLFAFFSTSCQKTIYSSIPEYPVFYRLSFHSSEAKPLYSSGGYVYITRERTAEDKIGFGGILLINSPTKEGVFYAYDLSCPKEIDPSIKIFVNEHLEAECPKCKSSYSIIYGGGSPVRGVSDRPLLSYQVIKNSLGDIIVTNR